MADKHDPDCPMHDCGQQAQIQVRVQIVGCCSKVDVPLKDKAIRFANVLSWPLSEEIPIETVCENMTQRLHDAVETVLGRKPIEENPDELPV